MAETTKLEMTEEEAAQLSNVLDEYLEKLDKIFERMDEDQVEIEHYRAETRAIIERMQGKAA